MNYLMVSKYYFLLMSMLIGVILGISLFLGEINNTNIEIPTPLNPHYLLNSDYISRNILQNSSTQYVEHTPIRIDGNADFAATAKLENWPGDGTFSNPYIIRYYVISYNTADLIDIQNTNVYFYINNNTLNGLNGRYNGIDLHNVSHGVIFHNIIHNNRKGIELWTTNDCNLTDNMVSKNNWGGIYLIDSGSITLTNNYISNNGGYGIRLDQSSEDNKVIQNDFIGNYVGESSQAFDNGRKNEFAYNYWDEWTNPDTNADGVVDYSYSIDGNAGNQDAYPLVSRFFDISRTSNTIPFSANTIAGLILLSIILCALVVLILKQKLT